MPYKNAIISISALVSHERNYRSHPEIQIKRLGDSLDRFSQYRSIVVQEVSIGEYKIVAGHGLVEAARRKGFTELRADILPVDMSEEEILGILVADNLMAVSAEDDMAALAELLEEQKNAGFDLESLGFSDDDLDQLLSDLANDALESSRRSADDPDGGGDDFNVTSDSEQTRVHHGDIWQLGRHRVMCGDSLNIDDVARLMCGKRAKMIFTDPPYNCADEMNSSFYAGSDSPAMKELSQAKWDQGFDINSFLSVLSHHRPCDGTVYICTSHMLAPDIWRWMRNEKAKHNNYCVWVKPNPMPSLAKRHPTWATEIICYGVWGKHTFNFPKDGHALNWWEIPANSANRLHPTQKPLGVPLRAIQYSSNANDIVADFFLGSGTTLIACERTDRICYGMELDPKYVSVILSRWESETGKSSSLISHHSNT